MRGAVAKFNPVPDPRRPADEPIRPFPGSVADWAAGNASVARLCPVPLFLHKYPEVAMDLSVDSSKVTHGADAASDSCRLFPDTLHHHLHRLCIKITPITSLDMAILRCCTHCIECTFLPMYMCVGILLDCYWAAFKECPKKSYSHLATVLYPIIMKKIHWYIYIHVHSFSVYWDVQNFTFIITQMIP